MDADNVVYFLFRVPPAPGIRPLRYSKNGQPSPTEIP
jgi:hypothetical protein